MMHLTRWRNERFDCSWCGIETIEATYAVAAVECRECLDKAADVIGARIFALQELQAQRGER